MAQIIAKTLKTMPSIDLEGMSQQTLQQLKSSLDKQESTTQSLIDNMLRQRDELQESIDESVKHRNDIGSDVRTVMERIVELDNQIPTIEH